LKKYLKIYALITIVSLILVGCSNETNNEDKAAFISINENSSYAKTFKDLSLGILFDFNLKVNNADVSWVRIWVEGYQNGEKTDPFHLTEISYGQSPNQVDEGHMGFGIINHTSEEPSLFLYSPSTGSPPHKLPNNIIMNKEAVASMWDYAIGKKTIGLDSGETKIIGVYRQTNSNSIRTYDYQDTDSINKMINEDSMVLLLKIKVEKTIKIEQTSNQNQP
jgi:hypothetical protein